MWLDTYQELLGVIESISSDTLLFRGHACADWPLIPGLGRLQLSNHAFMEEVAYFDFITRAGELLPEDASPWTTLFIMQHFGLPTRLLDWTETLGVAIYFAVREGQGDAAVWILDPFALNATTINREELIHPADLSATYDEYFIKKTKDLEGDVIALTPLRHNPRVFHQRAGFTLHKNIDIPLERLHPKVVRRIIIPAAARAGAQQFLRVAGISEFSLFPDLDGLARELKREHFDVQQRRFR